MNLKFVRTGFMIAVAALLLTACSSKLTEANLDKINNGMTPDEVKAVLGDPTSSQTGSALGIISGTTYVYHTDTSDVKITFVNDKVIATEGEFQMIVPRVLVPKLLRTWERTSPRETPFRAICLPLPRWSSLSRCHRLLLRCDARQNLQIKPGMKPGGVAPRLTRRIEQSETTALTGEVDYYPAPNGEGRVVFLNNAVFKAERSANHEGSTSILYLRQPGESRTSTRHLKKSTQIALIP